jgi:hypothetical protein
VLCLTARRILEAAGDFGIGGFVKAHCRFVVLGAVKPVGLVLHRRFYSLEFGFERIHINR